MGIQETITDTNILTFIKEWIGVLTVLGFPVVGYLWKLTRVIARLKQNVPKDFAVQWALGQARQEENYVTIKELKNRITILERMNANGN